MSFKKQGWLFLFAISLMIMLVTLVVFSTAGSDVSFTSVRLLGLYGFIMLSIAASITPFMREISKFLGQSFLKVHHVFAIFGTAFISLHPVLLALRLMDASVFLPRFDSWPVFWSLAGRPALLVLYVAAFAAFLRRKAPKHWRSFHALMYAALFLGIVHANLMGTDLQRPVIMILFNILFTVSIFAFFLKRYRSYRIRKRGMQP